MREPSARGGGAKLRLERERETTTIIDRPVHIDIFDRYELLREVEALQASGSDFTDQRPEPHPDLPAEDRLRFKILRDILEDPRGSKRPVIIGTRAMQERIASLAQQAPNFLNFLDIVRGAVALSRATRTALRLPPILLVGSPSIGKSRLLKLLGAALETKANFIDMPTVDSFQFAGQHAAYRGAKSGLASDALLGPSAQPIIVLDEYDKPSRAGSREQCPYAVFHGLLEEETAAAQKDQYLGVHFDCRNIIWIASANSLSAIPDSILSRLLIIEVASPDDIQRLAIVDRMLIEEMARYGNAFDVTSGTGEEIKQLLAAQLPRIARRAIVMALAFAAADDRRSIAAADVRRACEMTSTGSACSIGFLKNLPSSSM